MNVLFVFLGGLMTFSTFSAAVGLGHVARR